MLQYQSAVYKLTDYICEIQYKARSLDHSDLLFFLFLAINVIMVTTRTCTNDATTI